MVGTLRPADRVVAAALGAAVLIVGSVVSTPPLQAQGPLQTYTCAGGFKPVLAAPFIPLTSLKSVANPVIPKDPVTGAPVVRADLADYVANLNAAIRLGKALFWDMQAGSDNKTACATCHFQAGGDVRTRNQLNPGVTGTGFVENETLTGADFPFTADNDNVAGSQGVRASTFLGVTNSGAESTTSPTGFRQVTGKNAPSAVNAVFNHRQFWNGRAQPTFNGVTPFGDRDTTARVWTLDAKGNAIQVAITILNASLASQAVGPALNTVEMSASGRTFPDLGKKLLLLKPLGLQKVDATDSVLGPPDSSVGYLGADATTGLKNSYTSLVQQAFKSKWWNAKRSVTVNGKTYTMMQANFSLFWGLSIMLYEATLVSDDSPMDQYLATRVLDANGVLLSDDPTPLDQTVNRLAGEGMAIPRQSILNGLALFELPVAPPPSFPVPAGFGLGCSGCHVGAETTSASVRNLTGHGVEVGDVALKNAGFDLRLERMFTNLSWTPPGPLSPVPDGADAITFDPSTYVVNVTSVNAAAVSPINLPVKIYDTGWYNLGVRPTADDVGLGGADPFGKQLSWTRLFQTTYADPSFIKVPGNALPCAGAGTPTFPNQILNASGFPLLSGPLTKTEPTDVAGTFKVASLRNVEFTGPYFHNGGKATLSQVVEFYDLGGDFGLSTNPTKAPAIVPLQLSSQQGVDLVAFLVSLTDERVRLQKAPFDHPAIVVPNGHNSDGSDITVSVAAVGAAGSTGMQRFLNLNPFIQ